MIKKMLNYSAVLLLCFLPYGLTNEYSVWKWRGLGEAYFARKYKTHISAKTMPDRLIHLMEVYHLDAAQRNTDLNEQRFMYEESPYYEQGYIISEILERYRKMVMHVKRPMMYTSDTVFDTLARVEIVQKLYFEIYHLVNMAHEIARKFKYKTEFQNLDKPLDPKAYYEQKAREKHEAKLKAQAKKERDQFMKKLDGLIETQKSKDKSQQQKKYNKWWPLDYGWEINYYW